MTERVAGHFSNAEAHEVSRHDDGARLLEVSRQLSRELHLRAPRRLELDSSIERDLRLDSLGRVELFLRVERAYGVSLPERLLATAETLRDVLDALRTAPRSQRLVALAPVKHDEEPSPLALPDTALSLPQVLQWHVDAHGERVHIHLDQGGALQPISYAALLDGAASAAAGLRALGLRARQPLSIMLPTCPEYFYVFFGALLIGAVPVPLYPPARISQIEDHLRRQAHILSNARAPMLVTTAEVQRLGFFMTSLVEDLRLVTTPEELSRAGQPAGRAATESHEVALLQYTSGSTGHPKGVVLTHANLLANVRAMGEAIAFNAADVMVSWLPLYHDMGLIGAWLGSLYHGMPLVLMSPTRFLTRPARWLWAIHASHGTLSAAPNFAFELCASRIADDEIEGLDLGSWRMALNGAEPVSPSTVRRFCERFARYGFRSQAMSPVYGLAECSVGLAFPPPGRGPLIDRIQRAPFMREGRALPAAPSEPQVLELPACGHPLPRHEIRIVDSAGRELPDRQQGRLQFRGPSATRGYLDNAAESARLFAGEWLESGDLAYVAAGDVYITGRSKDLILRAGRNIHPHELEDAVGRIEGVRKGCVAVFGSPDPERGTERVVVVAETRVQASAARADLRARIVRLATDLLEMPPDDVVLAPPRSVPKTTSGKLRRSACRQAYERGALRKTGTAVTLQLASLALAGAGARLRRSLRSVTALAYAAYATVMFLIVAPCSWLLIATLPRFELRWRVLHATAGLLLRMTGTSLRVAGSDVARLAEAGVFVANHASYLDGLVLAAALPRPVRFVVKAELSRKWLTRIPLDRLHVHYVERFDAMQSVGDARRAREAIGKGKAPLLFFPEGTLIRTPGLSAFHMGAFSAAAEAGTALVPLVLRGTRSKLRAETWFLRTGSVEVVLGPVLEPKGRDFAAALELRNAARSWMLTAVQEPDLAAS